VFLFAKNRLVKMESMALFFTKIEKKRRLCAAAFPSFYFETSSITNIAVIDRIKF